MRNYGIVSPLFWTGETGRALRRLGQDAQLTALYLVTCPQANMIGLYHLCLPTMAHHLGTNTEGALKGLRRASEGGFLTFSEETEDVWVFEMASHQIGEPLSPKDNRVPAVVKEWMQYRKSKFFMDFYRRYKDSFHLPVPPKNGRPSEAPPKPLRSQEQDQDQEHAQSEACVKPSAEPSGKPSPEPSRNGHDDGFEAFWEAYPSKRAKGVALASWSRLAPDAQLVQVMLAALTRHKRSKQWAERGAIPNPAKWIDERRWEDRDSFSGDDSAARNRKAAEFAKRAKREKEEAAAPLDWERVVQRLKGAGGVEQQQQE